MKTEVVEIDWRDDLGVSVARTAPPLNALSVDIPALCVQTVQAQYGTVRPLVTDTICGLLRARPQARSADDPDDWDDNQGHEI
jgi:hypothetical protein